MTDRKKNVKCPDCGKVFTAQGLGSHRKVHETDRPAKKTGQSSVPHHITRGLNLYLKQINGNGSYKSISPAKISQVTEKIVAAQEAGHYLRALKLTESIRDANGSSINYENFFIENAKWYSDYHSISYESWRELGVPARVLSEAGITR